MTLKLDLSEPRFRKCDLCGGLDGHGGVQLEDDTGTRKVFCRPCTLDLLEACLAETAMPVPSSRRVVA